MKSEIFFMEHAIRLAKNGTYTASPNPLVKFTACCLADFAAPPALSKESLHTPNPGIFDKVYPTFVKLSAILLLAISLAASLCLPRVFITPFVAFSLHQSSCL